MQFSTLDSVAATSSDLNAKYNRVSSYLFIYLFAMFIQAIQFSNAGLNGGLYRRRIDDNSSHKILSLLQVVWYTAGRVQVPELNLGELPQEDLVP